MGFLKGLFKRKPGGTLVGNLLRGVAKGASGGILGNGGMMISQFDADKRDLSDDDFKKRYGYAKNDQRALDYATSIAMDIAGSAWHAGLPNERFNASAGNTSTSTNNTEKAVNSVIKTSIGQFLKKWWWATLLPFGIGITAVIYFFKNKNKRRRR
jgi:hypothetical protein